MGRGLVLGRVLALFFAAALAVSASTPLSSGEDEEEYTLFVSVDETKVSVVSGNLTLAITHDSWPRLAFWHTVDPFSATFDIGFPKIQLFNDTDGDGRFCVSETAYTAYLDANYVEWDVSTVEPGTSPDLGRFVLFSMSAVLDVYNQTLDSPPCVESWANVTFWFRLAENSLEYENPVGPHVVSGKTEVFVNMTLFVTNSTWFDSVAVERWLQGGGSASMFHILEDGPGTQATAVLPARIDDALEGDDFTRPLNTTDSPTQCIDIAKGDGTVQAFYHWGSAALALEGDEPALTLNSSCLTTGSGLILHSVLPLTNGTVSFSLDSSTGINEDGFVGGVVDWVKEVGLAITVAGAAAAVAVVVGLHVILRRRRLRKETAKEKTPEGPEGAA